MITDFVEDNIGNIWVATQSGLNKFDRKTGLFTGFLHCQGWSNTISSNIINRLGFDNDGSLWIATQNGRP
jgi:ligand-binding sensor domain-containing protein